jgi:4-hydroxy-tetrahydrodipicolinate reductase
MRIGIAGISGRMGRLVAEEVAAAGAVVSGGLARGGTSLNGVPAFPDVASLVQASDVMVDFTHADTACAHAAAQHPGCAWVLGTTGLSADAEAAVARAAAEVAVVWAANFSPGVTLLLDLARRLAASLPAEEYDAEILEMHHRQKRDAPSGTALALGQAVAAGRSGDLPSLRAAAREGQTGPRPPGAIGFASLRGGQVVGEHTLLFAGADEHISIRHEALDRRIFARGAVRAALWTQGRGPGLYDMRDVLGLPRDAASTPPKGPTER